MPGNQDWRTPKWFLVKLDGRFGLHTVDMAATPEDAVCSSYCCDYADPVEWEHFRDCNIFMNPPWSDLQRVCRLIVKHDPGSLTLLRHADLSPGWNEPYLDKFDNFFIHPRVAYTDPTSEGRTSPSTGTLVQRYPGTGKCEVWNVFA